MRIMACAALDVQSNDGLPKCICQECRYQLEKSFYFRKRSQLADTKLRKHIRFLSLGKKSRIFHKRNDDEDSGDELEFEDSVKFIKEQEELYDKNKLEYKEKLRLEMEEKLLEVLKTQDEYLQKELKQRSAQLKKQLRDEMWQEVYNQVRIKLEPELREQLRSECMQAAKVEVRVEVQRDCRAEELDLLLNEIDIFLRHKRAKVVKDRTKQNEFKELSSERKALKRSASPANLKEGRNLRSRVDDESTVLETTQQNNDNCSELDNSTIKDQSLPYEELTNTVIETIDDSEEDEPETEPNFYILETEPQQTVEAAHSAQPIVLDEDEDDVATYVASEESEHFPLAVSEDADAVDHTTLYQIEANGEIQTVKGKTEDVVYFNFDQVEDEDHLDMVEFVSLNKKIPTKPVSEVRKSVVEPPKKGKEAGNQLGFTKCLTNCDDTKSDGEQEPQKPYSRVTDTPKYFKCESCPMTFSTTNALTRHRLIHEKTQAKGVLHKCAECQVIFSCNSALKRHSVIHTGKRPYSCDECGKSFVQREILKRHQQVHTGVRPYQCPQCPSAYTQKVNLTEHMNHYHTKVPKLFQHSCHLCTKRFNHASGLSRHLATHSGITYQCTGCERTFGDRSSVKRHVVHVHGAANNENANKFIIECPMTKDQK